MPDYRLDRITRADVVVRYVEVADEPATVPTSFPRLEDAVGSLRGRRFLAAFDPDAGWYRACVIAVDDAGAHELALPQMLVAGGDYVRVRLRGRPPSLYDEIAPAYRFLERSAERDGARPSLEIYRREGEIDVLMAVAPPRP